MSKYRTLLRIDGQEKSVVVMDDGISTPLLDISKHEDGRILVATSTTLPTAFIPAAELVAEYADAFALALRELI